MWLIVILLLAVAGFATYSLGFLPPAGSKTLLRIREGQLLVQRGAVQSYARDHIMDILKEAGVTQGFISVTADKKVVFSRGIPKAAHQRIRNVLLNQ
jgi:hypothetical protein